VCKELLANKVYKALKVNPALLEYRERLALLEQQEFPEL